LELSCVGDARCGIGHCCEVDEWIRSGYELLIQPLWGQSRACWVSHCVSAAFLGVGRNIKVECNAIWHLQS
jgi:hypothetical protein